MAYIMEIYGLPGPEIIKMASRGHLFFENGKPILSPNSKGKVRKPLSKKLENVIQSNDPVFLDFLNRCFHWNPVERISPLEALQHPWILQGLPDKVLKHHEKMFKDTRSNDTISKYTLCPVQGFP